MSQDAAATGTGADLRAGPAEVAAIPLVEERLSIAKRQVESGRLRVHVMVDERQEVVAQDLARDEVDVERVPRNVPLSEMPHVRLEGTTTIIPVVEEVLVVEKRLMLVEEIHVRRRSDVERREVPVTLRSERASVERQPVAGGEMPGVPQPQPRQEPQS